jgi:hypothetical protein
MRLDIRQRVNRIHEVRRRGLCLPVQRRQKFYLIFMAEN